MNEIAMTSWNELSDRLHELAWNPSLNRLRSNFVYRGMPCQGYELMTSLQLGGPYHDLEAAILVSFRTYAEVIGMPSPAELGAESEESEQHGRMFPRFQHGGSWTRSCHTPPDMSSLKAAAREDKRGRG